MANAPPPPETLKALFEESCARWRARPAFSSSVAANVRQTLAWG